MPSNTLRLPNLSAVHFCSTAFCPFPATATRGPPSPHRSTEWSKWPASERARQPSPFPSPLFPLVFDDPLRPSFTERNLRPCRSPFHVTCSEEGIGSGKHNSCHPSIRRRRPRPEAGLPQIHFNHFKAVLGEGAGRIWNLVESAAPTLATWRRRAARSNSCWWSGLVSPLVLMVPERARERGGVAPKTWERANRDWKSNRAYISTNRFKSRCIRAWMSLRSL